MKFSPGTAIGIVGGGQLARMLVLKGREMGLAMHVMSASRRDPAAQVCPLWRKGDPTSPRALADFFKRVSVVTFESEFYRADLFAHAAARTGVEVKPSPRVMGLLQDRWTQKGLFAKHRVPTADFGRVDTFADAEEAFAELGPCVFKTRMGGYDGYGTFIVKRRKDLDALRPLLPGRFIAEALIPFKRELAVSLARNSAGKITVLPLVETHQRDARCLWARGPVRHRAAAALVAKLKRLLAAERYEGVIAFELFDVGGRLLVNEAAPRVHNSAHYSLDALIDDQFTLHLKAILGARLPAESAPTAPAFAMWNLLGGKRKEPRWRYPQGAHLHWYGKSDNRPGRKMGHVNAVGATPQAALSRARRAAKEIEL